MDKLQIGCFSESNREMYGDSMVFVWPISKGRYQWIWLRDSGEIQSTQRHEGLDAGPDPHCEDMFSLL